MKNLIWTLATILTVMCSVALSPWNAAAQYTATNLVSNSSTYNPINIDPNLVDAWGLAALPTSPWWVSAQNTSTSTLYSASGAINSLVVDIPCVTDFTTGATTQVCPFPGEGDLDEPNNTDIASAIGGANAACTAAMTPNECCTGLGTGTCDGSWGGGPAGIVANPFPKAFEITGAGAAQFIFATQDALIVAWNPANGTQSVVEANRSLEGTAPLFTSYQGLAIAGPAKAPHLYATNIFGAADAAVDVFDKNFNYVDSFPADSNLPEPSGPEGPFTPYGIQAIGKKLYVTYFAPLAPLPPAGAGAGILDVCDLSKSTTNPPCKRLAASNLDGSETSPTLNQPWGIALAPANFGTLGDTLLVGNLNDGLIHGFKPSNGTLRGTLDVAANTPFAVPGLWALQFGDGSSENGPRNHLFFTAGPSPVSETDLVQQYGAGLFGVIAVTPKTRSH
jgi:uncharacterized protein (TIGR03118 family)